MHLRTPVRAFFALALWFSAARLVAQSPTVPAPDREPAVPLITDSNALTDEIPTPIPDSTNDSITATENAVLAAHDASIAAAEALALDTLFSVLVPTNRGAMISDGHLTLSQDEVMAATRRDFERIASLHYNYTQRYVTLLSPTSAFIAGTGTVSGTTTDGITFSRPFAQTIVFMRIGESWKVVHLHGSRPFDQFAR